MKKYMFFVLFFFFFGYNKIPKYCLQTYREEDPSTLWEEAKERRIVKESLKCIKSFSKMIKRPEPTAG